MSNSTQISNNRKLFTENSPLLKLNLRKVMLVWPLHINHTSTDAKNCSGCFVTPISPAVNARDVTDSRLHDDFSTTSIDQTLCHAIIGERINNFSLYADAFQAVTNSNMFDMFSIFDRYNKLVNKDDINLYGYFNGTFDVAKMRQTVKKILTDQNSIIKNHTTNSRHTMNSKIDKLTPAYLLQFTLDAICNEYGQLKTDENYENLVHSLSSLPSLRSVEVPNCVKTSSKKLFAIYLFQQAFPYCCAFLNGNHRHCRFIFQELMLGRNERRDVIDDAHVDGYVIPVMTNINSVYYDAETLIYQFYLMAKLAIGQLMIDEFQSFSLQINEQSSKTVPNEPCHR
jgi:hypothetical protein